MRWGCLWYSIPMSKNQIEALLIEHFKPVVLEVIDESYKHVGHAGARQGGHYQVRIESAVFDGVKPIDGHRMIYEAVKPIKHLIHALAISAKGVK